MFLLQINASLILQSIGLTILQAIFTAPVYGLGVYWGITLAFKHLNQKKVKGE